MSVRQPSTQVRPTPLNTEESHHDTGLDATGSHFHDGDSSTTTRKTSSIAGTSFNLLNNILGAGILGTPYALRQSGIIAGLLLFLLVAYLTDKSLRILVEASSYVEAKLTTKTNKRHDHQPVLGSGGNINTHIRSYEELTSYIFGTTGKNGMRAVILIGGYGSLLAYLIIIKDIVPAIMGIDRGGVADKILLIVTSFSIVLPLSMQHDLASLSAVSGASVLADVVLAGLVAAFAPILQSLKDYPGGLSGLFRDHSFNFSGIFIALGIISYSMGCQGATFVVYKSLSYRNPRRWSIVTASSVALSSFLTLIFGFSGYLGFLDETQGDVLLNFGKDFGQIMNVARVLVCITIFLTYPMPSFVCRDTLLILLQEWADHDNSNTLTENDEQHEPCTVISSRHVCSFRNLLHPVLFCFRKVNDYMDTSQRVTLLLYISALLPALFLDDVGPVLSILGAVGGSIRAYIAPGMIYLGVYGDSFLDYAEDSLLSSLGGRRKGGIDVRVHDEEESEYPEKNRDKENRGIELSSIKTRAVCDQRTGQQPYVLSRITKTCPNGNAETPIVILPPLNAMGTQLNETEQDVDFTSMSSSNQEDSSRTLGKGDNNLGLDFPSPEGFESYDNSLRSRPSTVYSEDDEDTLEMSVDGVRNFHQYRKPAWWYLLGFPFWCVIAACGSNCLRTQFAAITAAGVSTQDMQVAGQDLAISESDATGVVREEEEQSACSENEGNKINRFCDEGRGDKQVSTIHPPSSTDFAKAVFFISFGVVSGTAGLAMNIYKIFFQ